jgi:hypothetical protein
MRVSILREAGYEEAMLGLSLNKNKQVSEMPRVAGVLTNLGGGHNQFLQHIVVWLDVLASRGWWHQFAKYHFKEEQSESTTHTITRKGSFMRLDFLNPDAINPDHIEYLNAILCSGLPESEMYEILTENLPEGFLQRRIVTTNYQTLRTIIDQRYHHKRPEWQQFIRKILHDIEHPEFLEGVVKKQGGKMPERVKTAEIQPELFFGDWSKVFAGCTRPTRGCPKADPKPVPASRVDRIFKALKRITKP